MYCKNLGDYVAVESFLTLMAGSSPRACVNVGITNDVADEINERFRINMAVVGSPWPTFRTTTEVVINDDGGLDKIACRV